MGDQPKVSAGWQTWIGYGLSAVLVAAPLVMDSLDRGDSWQQIVLVVAGALLAAVTGKNRSDQAVALVGAGGHVGVVGGAAVLSSADQNVELSDSMPMDAHEPNAE